jgi:hypothetical protein
MNRGHFEIVFLVVAYLDFAVRFSRWLGLTVVIVVGICSLEFLLLPSMVCIFSHIGRQVVSWLSRTF